jgi:hypothetical protein
VSALTTLLLPSKLFKSYPMPKPSVTCQVSLIYYSSHFKSMFDIVLKSLKVLSISKKLC